MNPEIIRLIREEGATVHLSGDRYGFNAGLNVGHSGNPYWLVEAQGSTPEEALSNLLSDESVKPQVES